MRNIFYNQNNHKLIIKNVLRIPIILRNFFNRYFHYTRYFQYVNTFCVIFSSFRAACMLTYETIKKLCKEKGVTVTKVEKDLGFAKGSLCKLNTNKPSLEKVQKLAEYFGVSVNFFTGSDGSSNTGTYYHDNETAQMAQEIFENKELRLLFSAARDASPEDLKTTHDMLMALKRKERGYNDDTGV